MKFSLSFGCVSSVKLINDCVEFTTGTVHAAEGTIEVDGVKYIITKNVAMNFPSQSQLSLYLPSYLTEEIDLKSSQ